MTELLEHLRRGLGDGRKLLVPYLMPGVPEPAAFAELFAAIAAHADVVEIGLPFSDPLMDGPVIASAGERAIRNGVGPLGVLDIEWPESAAPRVAMTYYNPIHRCGETEFCRRAAAAGFTGLIVPDLPVEESASLRAAAAGEGLAWIPLVAPTSPPVRVKAAVATGTGFVYAVSTLGVTGARTSLSERAAKVVDACRAETDLPVLIGVGVSNAEQAVGAAAVADGVVVGSALIRIALEQGTNAATQFIQGIRQALAP